MAGLTMSIADAYQTCADITRREARNFSYGIRLLPPPKRQAMSAVYAMARRIDDIGDGGLPGAEKLRRLAATRDALHRLAGGSADDGDPVLRALGDAAARLPIPLDAFDDLIAGCEDDVNGRRYATFDELVEYCRRVAGSIGRLSVGVYAPSQLEAARPLADDLGVALQLTNVVRDICEDRVTGRIYLPAEDLRRFGCRLDLDAQQRIADPPDRFAELIRFQAGRAQLWYDRGLTLLPLLDRRSAACTAAMAGIYRRLLQRMAADPDPIRRRRLSLSTGAKVVVAARALTGGTP